MTAFAGGGDLLNSEKKCPSRAIAHKFLGAFKAFTLAEVLVTLTILGIVASITVPGIVKRQTERTNKTKIKKALSTYETVINKIAVENGIKSIDGLKNWTAGDATCGNSVQYFKHVERDGCTFKTADGLWWDVGKSEGYDLSRVMVSLKEENLTKPEAESPRFNAFVFITTFDKNGGIRINDVGYEENEGSTATKQETKKVHAYLNGEDFDMKISDRNCANCVVTIGSNQETYDENGRLIKKENSSYSVFYTYDEDGKLIEEKYSGSSTSRYIYTYDEKGRLLTKESTYSFRENLVVDKYYYDGDSDIVSKHEHYSAHGKENETEYHYDNGKYVGQTYSIYSPQATTGSQSIQQKDEHGTVTNIQNISKETGEVIVTVNRTPVYNEHNDLVHIETINSKTNATSVVDYEYTYNKNNQKLTEIQTSTSASGTVTTTKYCYTYDVYGNQTSRKQCS